MKGLDRKFSVNFMENDQMISNSGNFSTVYKVRDDNGEVYCAKLPPFNIDYNDGETFVDPERIKAVFKRKDDFMNMVAASRIHEAKVARDIYDDFGYTLKPEGAFDVKVEGVKDFYLPAFVNEFDSDMKPLKFETIEFNEESEKMLKNLLENDFMMHWDSFSYRNFLYSKDRGYKMIDFGMVSRGRDFNPFPMYAKTNRETNASVMQNTMKWREILRVK